MQHSYNSSIGDCYLVPVVYCAIAFWIDVCYPRFLCLGKQALHKIGIPLCKSIGLMVVRASGDIARYKGVIYS